MGRKEQFYADIMAIQPEVTGSCNLVIVKLPDKRTIRFIVDCGLFQEKDYEDLNQNFPFNPENIDFCLVTHNHVDHTGRLPLLVRKGFRNKIYTTQATAKFLPLALGDCYKVLRELSTRKNKACLYKESDVVNTIDLISPCSFNQSIRVNENIKVMFLNNGHLVGAAMILVLISYPNYESIKLLFTGDFNNKNTLFKVNPIPKWIRKLPLTIIQEATYGDMNSEDIEKCFSKNILKCLNNNGTVIAPVFSLGRSQEILYELKLLQDKGKLNKEIPIYLDGNLAIKYTNIYINEDIGINESKKNFLPVNLKYVDKEKRIELLSDQHTKIILTTSGMGSYGPAQIYIPEYLGRSDTIIHFTGFAAEGTMAARLKDTHIGDIVEYSGLVLKKRAIVEYTKEFSAHAKSDEMIAFLQQFKNAKLILVNHGENDVKNKFAERILKEVDVDQVGILGREYFFRINPYGLVKAMSTKFE